MYGTLAAGTAVRTITTADLNIPYDETGADGDHAAAAPTAAPSAQPTVAVAETQTAPVLADVPANAPRAAFLGRPVDVLTPALASLAEAAVPSGSVKGGTDGAAILPQRSGPAPGAGGVADPASQPAAGLTGLTMVGGAGAGVPGTVHGQDEDRPSLPEGQPGGVLPVLEQAASPGLGRVQEQAAPALRGREVAAERVLSPGEQEVSIPASGVIAAAVERNWAWAGVLAVLLGAAAPDHQGRRRADRLTLKS
jgi:hypothetical protein